MATTGKTVCSQSTKAPRSAAGAPASTGTRIRVADIGWLQREGYTPEKMLEVYPSLNLAQLHAALFYYFENPREMESALQEDREVAEKIERDRDDSLRNHSAQ